MTAGALTAADSSAAQQAAWSGDIPGILMKPLSSSWTGTNWWPRTSHGVRPPRVFHGVVQLRTRRACIDDAGLPATSYHDVSNADASAHTHHPAVSGEALGFRPMQKDVW